MLDAEIASIMKFLIDAAGNPGPYYYNIPENFVVPAIYFPQPEISTRGDTLKTYALEFSWFVKFFGKDTQSAQQMAFAVMTALQRRKNVVPLIDAAGALTGRGFRMKDPSFRIADDGVVQMTLTWDSSRPYFEEEAQKITDLKINMRAKGAFDSAVTKAGGKNGRKKE